MASMFRLLGWIWRLIGEADTAAGIYTALGPAFGAAVMIFAILGGLHWGLALVLGLVVAILFIVLVAALFWAIDIIRRFFTDRQARVAIPKEIMNNLQHQVTNVSNVVKLEKRYAEMKPMLSNIDPYINFIVAVVNPTILQIHLESFSGSVSFENERLATIPSLTKPGTTIGPNRTGSAHIMIPVSDSFRSWIKDMPDSELRERVALTGSIKYSYYDLRDEKQTRDISVPRDYFIEER